jgi:hypothetical protein
MLGQGKRTLLAAVLFTGITVVGVFASANPSLAVPRPPTMERGIYHPNSHVVLLRSQISSSAYRELALP